MKTPQPIQVSVIRSLKAFLKEEKGRRGPEREWRAAICRYVSKISPGADDSRTHPTQAWVDGYRKRERKREEEQELLREEFSKAQLVGAVFHLPIFERMESREEEVVSTYAHI